MPMSPKKECALLRRLFFSSFVFSEEVGGVEKCFSGLDWIIFSRSPEKCSSWKSVLVLSSFEEFLCYWEEVWSHFFRIHFRRRRYWFWRWYKANRSNFFCPSCGEEMGILFFHEFFSSSVFFRCSESFKRLSWKVRAVEITSPTTTSNGLSPVILKPAGFGYVRHPQIPTKFLSYRVGSNTTNWSLNNAIRTFFEQNHHFHSRSGCEEFINNASRIFNARALYRGKSSVVTVLQSKRCTGSVLIFESTRPHNLSVWIFFVLKIFRIISCCRAPSSTRSFCNFKRFWRGVGVWKLPVSVIIPVRKCLQYQDQRGSPLFPRSVGRKWNLRCIYSAFWIVLTVPAGITRVVIKQSSQACKGSILSSKMRPELFYDQRHQRQISCSKRETSLLGTVIGVIKFQNISSFSSRSFIWRDKIFKIFLLTSFHEASVLWKLLYRIGNPPEITKSICTATRIFSRFLMTGCLLGKRTFEKNEATFNHGNFSIFEKKMFWEKQCIAYPFYDIIIIFLVDRAKIFFVKKVKKREEILWILFRWNHVLTLLSGFFHFPSENGQKLVKIPFASWRKIETNLSFLVSEIFKRLASSFSMGYNAINPWWFGISSFFRLSVFPKKKFSLKLSVTEISETKCPLPKAKDSKFSPDKWCGFLYAQEMRQFLKRIKNIYRSFERCVGTTVPRFSRGWCAFRIEKVMEKMSREIFSVNCLSAPEELNCLLKELLPVCESFQSILFFEPGLLERVQ